MATGDQITGGSEPSEIASFAMRRSPLLWAQHLLHDNPTVVPAVILLLAVATFSTLVGSNFYDPFNLTLILQQVTIIGIVGIAQTLVLLIAGVDLSVGAIMVLAMVVMGNLAVHAGVPTPLAILIGIGVSGICGYVNGLLVTYFRMPPFIVTLGTWNMFYAVMLWSSSSETIRQQEVQASAPLLQWFGTPIDILSARLTYGSVLLVIMIVLFWYIINHTGWGRHVCATGDGAESARLSGIRTGSVMLGVYTLTGIICGIAGWVLIGRIGAISPVAGATTNLDSVTAVVIGGSSLFGGRGSILGTLLGALIVGVFRDGLILANVDVLWQNFALGSMIILAVMIDQWIRRVSS